MKTIIHVNQHKIKRNTQIEDVDLHESPISCRTYNGTKYGKSAAILDENGKEVARIVYSPHKPLSCGARVWIETHGQVVIIE